MKTLYMFIYINIYMFSRKLYTPVYSSSFPACPPSSKSFIFFEIYENNLFFFFFEEGHYVS